MSNFIKLSSRLKFVMPFFYMYLKQFFYLIRWSTERFQVSGILQYTLFRVSTCSPWKQTLKRRGFAEKQAIPFPSCDLLVQRLNVPHCHQSPHSWSTSAGHTVWVSSDGVHVQRILEKLLLSGNASFSFSNACHTHILMVGVFCFMPPPQFSWYMCR